MRLTPVNNPCYLNGNAYNSGDVKTGELQTIRGGGRCITVFSGNAILSGVLPAAGTATGNAANNGGYDLLVWSGAGRLNSIMPLAQIQSGLPTLFYDSAVNTSGGPFAASGHKIVGQLPGTFAGGAWSGLGIVAWTGGPINVDLPFQSGLVIALKSGQAGFTCSFTPENSSAFPNT